MRACNRHFPGTDDDVSERMTRDIETDEAAMLEQLRALRAAEGASLESIGFLLGADPAQVSRYLKGSANIPLITYLRIARALGARCKITLEPADPLGEAGRSPLGELRIAAHKVRAQSR
jgi:transcriptional regulator with XRE-family HTH domain